MANIVGNSSPIYVTLVSDSSMHIFPKNNAQEWTTKLKTPITVTGRWEVALVELQYTNSIYNIPSKQELFVEEVVELSEETSVQKRTQIDLPPGKYTLQELIVRINNQVPESADIKNMSALGRAANKKVLYVRYDPLTHKTEVTFMNLRAKLYLPPDGRLKGILGFIQESDVIDPILLDTDAGPTPFGKYLQKCRQEDPVAIYLASPLTDTGILKYLLKRKQPLTSLTLDVPFKITSNKAANVRHNNETMFVYSDIADFSAVGDEHLQFLRSTAIKGEDFELVTERFDEPHYVPLLRNHIETVEISLSSEDRQFAFQSGKSLVKLHFRPARY